MTGKLLPVLALAVTLASCMHTAFGYENSGRAWIRVTEGNAVLDITARVARDVYGGPDRGNARQPGEERRPAVPAGAVTRNETVSLSAGGEISFRVMPSETVTVRVVSADGGDVEVTSRDTRGRERSHSVPGENRLGVMIVF